MPAAISHLDGGGGRSGGLKRSQDGGTRLLLNPPPHPDSELDPSGLRIHPDPFSHDTRGSGSQAGNNSNTRCFFSVVAVVSTKG